MAVPDPKRSRARPPDWSDEDWAYSLLANALTVEEYGQACEEVRSLGLDPDTLMDRPCPTQTDTELAKRLALLVGQGM